MTRSYKCDAELSQFWKELPSCGVAEGSRMMVLPAVPPRSGLPRLKSMYVRESYERLTDMVTDGGLHLDTWFFRIIASTSGSKQVKMQAIDLLRRHWQGHPGHWLSWHWQINMAASPPASPCQHWTDRCCGLGQRQCAAALLPVSLHAITWFTAT